MDQDAALAEGQTALKSVRLPPAAKGVVVDASFRRRSS